jgi:hypothetical protein
MVVCAAGWRLKLVGVFSKQELIRILEWFWGQTTHKSAILVLRLNQETRASSLHVPGADRIRHHPTSRPPGHRVPGLCDHPRSSAPGLLLLPRSSSLHAMPHLPPTHHETSKRDSPNETKVKEKQNNPGFEFKPRQVNDSSQSNQGTDHLVSQYELNLSNYVGILTLYWKLKKNIIDNMKHLRDVI